MWIGLGKGIGMGEVLNWNVNVPKAGLLQRLAGNVNSDGYTLPDTSGNGYDATLVNGNCMKGDGNINTSVLSNTPTADGMLFYDFSVEFNFSCQSTSAHIIIGRCNGGGSNNLLSAFVVISGALRYYSASGSANSQVALISSITLGQEYNVKCSVTNSTGSISWVINGTPGSNTFTNRTPNSDQSNDSVAIGRGIAAYALQNNTKVCNVKHYTSVNYLNLAHYWPCTEGAGSTIYDVIGNKDITLSSSLWATQNLYHYNYTKGFELYGDSGATSSIIRVPYNNDGTLTTPTIVGYTKFASCPAGSFNNMSESGIKRNPSSVAALTSAGVDSSNVIYWGGLDGNDNKTFVKGWMGDEYDYCIYSTSVDRKSYFRMPDCTDYFAAGSTRRVIGSSGKIHTTSFKNGIKTASYDYFIRTGTYNITASANLSIMLPNACRVIGENRETTIINGALANDSGNVVINARSVFDAENITATGYGLYNFTATATNLKYVVHDDFTVQNLTRTFKQIKLIHYGNADSYALDPLVSPYCDAFGSGWRSGGVYSVENSYFRGNGDINSEYGRGWAAHSNESETTAAQWTFTDCEFDSENGDNSFRVHFVFTAASGKKDAFYFDGCDFNSKDIAIDGIDIYEVVGDKIQLYSKLGDVNPDINYLGSLANKSLIGLEFEADTAGHLISAVAGTTTTLLMGTVVSGSSGGKNHVRGEKNITDDTYVTGHVHLGADMLGDCSGVNKTMQLIVNSVTYTITFDADYRLMTNTQVIAAINTKLDGESCPATCKEYDYLTNASFRTY